MLFSDFVKLPDKDKVVLVEVKVGKEVQDESWTATGGGSHWCSFTDGEIVAVSELLLSSDVTTDYTKVASIASCDSTTSSFYFDFNNQRLYIHTSGDDAPDTAGKYNIIAYFWVCLTNQQDEEDLVVYAPQDASNKVYYLPYLNPAHAHSLLQQVKDFYTGIVPWYRATLKFLNDGWWYGVLKKWLWHNKDIEVKVGQKGSSYNDFEVIIKGKTRNPAVSDEGTDLEVRDARVGELRQLPIYKFWKSDYANLEDEAEGMSIPVLFGKGIGIVPVCIDTSTWTYKVNFYAQEAIDAVYKDGVKLILDTDYTVSANKDEFTLTDDPGEAKITCDARGVRCDKDASTYSENIGDVLWYVLNTLNSIPVARLDGSAFDSLIAARNQKIAWYMGESISTFNFIRLLQQTGLFQFIPLPNGKYTVKFYESGVPAGTPELRDEDYAFLRVFYKTSAIYSRAVVKYDKDLDTREWEQVEYSDDKTAFKYDDEQSFIVESVLRLKDEAESLVDMYRQMAVLYEKRVKGKISAEGMGVLPTGKIKFTKSVIGAEGESISVLSEEVYRILELRKDFKTTEIEVMGIKDAIGSSHANVSHSDTHENVHSDIYTDTHTNVIHTNVVHENVSHNNVPHDDQEHLNEPHLETHNNNPHDNQPHENGHGDIPHADEPHENDVHVNIAHENVDYVDMSHQDSHTDSPHYNQPHENVSHDNVSHQNVLHGNVAHANVLHDNSPHEDDPHVNVPHQNVSHENEEHLETHNNVPHTNTPHGDGHGDIAHDDEPHENVPHENIAHEDVEYADVSHQDSHTDDSHYNQPHENVSHENVLHQNVAHGNVAHVNVAYDDVTHENILHDNIVHQNVSHENEEHLETHTNNLHVDTHGDGHGDIPHEDEPHENDVHVNIAHEDVDHADTPHTNVHGDSYTDTHGNTGHSNEPYADDYTDWDDGN